VALSVAPKNTWLFTSGLFYAVRTFLIQLKLKAMVRVCDGAKITLLEFCTVNCILKQQILLMFLQKNILLIICSSLAITTIAQTKQSKLASIMQSYHNYNMFDGAVLVAENGKVIYKAAFGKANRDWNIPNTTDTKFMIGSVSKPITAMLMLLQVQKGLVSLDKTIADYLPVFSGKPAAQIAIRQLLSHASGMPNYDIIKDFFPRISRQNFSREEYIKIYMDSALSFEPGTKYNYSSWGYFTLGYIMEKVTGKTFAALMKEEIFDKLGMNSSGSYFHTQIVGKRATGYDYAFGGYTSADFRDQSNTMGTGDLYSTVEDLFKFHLAISNHTLLNKELTKAMLTPGIKPADYGFGWFNKNFKYTPTDSIASNFHLGMTDGFISFMLRIPSTNSLVVILCNNSPTDFFGITGNLVKVLYNKPVTIKEPVHKAVEKIIAKDGSIKAVEAYKKMKADSLHYYVDWISMNFVAEQLLTLKRYEDARIISENNAAEFPTKDLVMVTMGNIYLALNRKADAIFYYKKALEIYPGYQEAKSRLKELEGK
jgi:CubicO group peptidase (beta-lactamase class C family)